MKAVHPSFNRYAYFVASAFVRGAVFLVSVICLRFLTTDQYGLWVILLPILTYSVLASGGTMNAMNRLGPIYLGEGNKEQLDIIYLVTMYSTLYSSLAVSGMVLLFSILNDSFELRIASFFLVLVIFNSLHQVLLVYNRCTLQFDFLSNVLFIYGAGYLVFSIIGLLYFSLIGFLGAQILSLIIANFALISRHPVSHSLFFFDINIYKRLVKEGLPIAITSLVLGFALISDRYVIAFFIGFDGAGLYALSILVHSFFSAVPTIVIQYSYPRMGKQLGSANEDELLIEDKLLRSYIYWWLAFAAVVIFFSVPLLGYLFPQYEEGTDAAMVNLAAAFLLTLSGSHQNLLLLYGMHALRMYLTLFIVIVNIISSIGFLLLGFGIEGVAIATTLSCALYWILSKHFADRIRNGKVINRFS